MNIDDIKLLHYNSFFSSHLIVHFLSGCKDLKIKHEMIFLVLPFIYHSDSREILSSLNTNSTIYTAFLESERGKFCLGGIEKRYANFKALTQKALLVSATYRRHRIIVSEYISVPNILRYEDEIDDYIKQFYKSAHYLGHILSQTNYPQIFIQLGIREL
jgi:hypothetical protein